MAISRSQLTNLFTTVYQLAEDILRSEDTAENKVVDYLHSLHALVYELALLKSKKITFINAKDIHEGMRNNNPSLIQDTMIKCIVETLHLVMIIDEDSSKLILQLLT